MNSKKLERIIILILLLLNVSLLLVVLTDGAQERRSDRDTADSIAALLRENGIEVSPGANLLQSAPRECSVVRNLDAERERMRALLGAVSAEDQGGSIYYYRAADGQAVMRGTGEFDMLFTAGAVRARGDAKKAAQRLFARADIALDEASMRLSDDGETLLACCAWNGYAVWNAALEISFSGDSFYTVFGTLVFDRETAEGEAGMDSLSALLRFRARRQRGNYMLPARKPDAGLSYARQRLRREHTHPCLAHRNGHRRALSERPHGPDGDPRRIVCRAKHPKPPMLG